MFNSFHIRSIKHIRKEWGVNERTVVDISPEEIKDKDTFQALAVWKAYVPQQLRRRALYARPVRIGKRLVNRIANVTKGDAFRGSFTYSLLSDKLGISNQTISKTMRIAQARGWIDVERRKTPLRIDPGHAALVREYCGMHVYFENGLVWLNEPNVYSILYKAQRRACITL